MSRAMARGAEGQGRAGIGERMAHGAYRAVLRIAAGPLRSRRRYVPDPETGRERAGQLAPPPAYAAGSPRFWLHGSSVGEINALPPIIAELESALPEAGVMLSAFTDTGRDAARRLVGPEAAFALPLDLPGPLRRVFDALVPDALLLTETELWPGLLREADARRVPVVLLNGRLMPRSVARYRFLSPLFARSLAGLAGVAAQSEADRERFIAIGVPARAIEVTGSSKFDTIAIESNPAPPLDLGGRPVIVAGSTRDGDEATVLAALDLLAGQGMARPLVILAPRHLTRVPEVERLAAERGWRATRRSLLPGPLADAAARAARHDRRSADLLLLDTLGELAEAYRLGLAAVVGGGFHAAGGHNLLEPAARGRPVIFGVRHRSAAGEVDLLLASGGGVRAKGNASDLAAALAPFVADPGAAAAAGERARRAVLARRGAARRSVEFALARLGFDAPRPGSAG